MPSVISVLVTPRVSADAGVAIAASAAAAIIVNLNFMVGSSLRVPQDRLAPGFDRDLGGVGVHALDQLLVFLVHELALQLHRRRQLFVFRRQPMLNQTNFFMVFNRAYPLFP